jgi:hypothetical protein
MITAFLIFLERFKNKEMLKKRIVFFAVVILFPVILCSSCTANRKLKKKCRDCPEFSHNLNYKQHLIAAWDENK